MHTNLYMAGAETGLVPCAILQHTHIILAVWRSAKAQTSSGMQRQGRQNHFQPELGGGGQEEGVN